MTAARDVTPCRCWSFLAALALFTAANALSAAEPDAAPSRETAPVARQIDQEVQKRLDAEKRKPSPRTDDTEFLRRVYLDITGHLPTAETAAAFLDSTAPDKRAQLIDSLLASPAYGRNFAIIWRTMLVKRDDANRILDTKAYTDWLAKSFNENRGWNQIVRDIVTAEGATDQNPQGLFFLANRDMTRIDPAKVTGAVSNLFLGVQLQCAECHNHPFVKQWKHTDFWGMAAFFGRVRDDTTPAKANQPPKVGNIVESASAKTQGKRPGGFGGGGGSVPAGSIAIPSPTVPGRTVGVAKAKFFEGEEAKLSDRPAYRPVIAEWLTAPTNKYFARAAVNRWWAHFFARGLVNPVEDMHDDNEPSHPELLTLLADEFVAANFDIKHLIRVLCNSEVYQRSSQPLAENKEGAELYVHRIVKVMSAEVLYDSLTQAMGAEPAAGGGGGPRFGGGGRGQGGGGREQFVRFFDTKDDDDATDSGHGIPQFLRLMNSASFNRTTALVDRLLKDKVSREQALQSMFLTTLSRRPTATEVEKFSAYLEKQGDARKGYTGVMWVLLNSAEFICIR